MLEARRVCLPGSRQEPLEVELLEVLVLARAPVLAVDVPGPLELALDVVGAQVAHIVDGRVAAPHQAADHRATRHRQPSRLRPGGVHRPCSVPSPSRCHADPCPRPSAVVRIEHHPIHGGRGR
jgi:hypothetical protein